MEKKKEKIFIFVLFQTIASTILISFIFFSSWSLDQNIRKTTNYILIIAILIKIGMYPFQNWLIKVIKNISWNFIAILFSWQKIIPIIVIAKSIKRGKGFFVAIIVSIFILNFLMIKLSNIKIVITISSLIHNTWIIIPLIIIKEISIAYLFWYRIVIIPLVVNFLKINSKNIAQQRNIKIIRKETKSLILSIRGIPPSIGFLIKIFILLSIIKLRKKFIRIRILIISSCITFFIYLQAFMKNFFNEKMKTLKKNQLQKKNEIKETSWVILYTPIILWY